MPKIRNIVSILWGFLYCFQSVVTAQSSSERSRSSQPIYKVTIIARTTKALNYGYLTGPTNIGFTGTPLIPFAKGEAKIQSKRGSTLVNAHFTNVPPPTQFGPEYLTYVVWAISPEGRAQNLGELTLDASNKGTLSASTAFQAFAMIVTAEPYYSVTQPSDVVIMENAVTPATIGRVEEVNATYELLPRKPYTYDPNKPKLADAAPVSQAEYDAILAIYQAQNAIQIAESQDAERYSPDRLARARQLLEKAKGYPKSLSKEIVALAREATQIAEDSRLIAVKRAKGSAEN